MRWNACALYVGVCVTGGGVQKCLLICVMCICGADRPIHVLLCRDGRIPKGPGRSGHAEPGGLLPHPHPVHSCLPPFTLGLLQTVTCCQLVSDNGGSSPQQLLHRKGGCKKDFNALLQYFSPAGSFKETDSYLPECFSCFSPLPSPSCCRSISCFSLLFACFALSLGRESICRFTQAFITGKQTQTCQKRKPRQHKKNDTEEWTKETVYVMVNVFC